MASRSRLVFARFSVGLVAVAAVVVVAVLALWATAIPPIVGWDAVAISSGSMEPLLGVGDVLVAEPYGGQELEPGAVLVFEDPSRPGLVSHRLEAVGEDGTLTTRGDANRDPDSTPLQPEAVVGIGRIVVPMIGWPAVWFGSGDLAPLLSATMALLVVLYAARWGILQRFDPWRSGPVSSTSATGPPGGGGDGSQSGTPMAWTTSVDDPPTRTGNSKELLGRTHISLFLAAGSAALVGAIAMLSVSFAAFPASTANAGNSYSADTLFTYSSIVLADNPSFWWRLGEPAGAGPGTFTEDFEGAFDWTIYQSGTFSASTAQAHGGTGSGLKNSNNDPNGGWKPLGFSTGTEWTMEAWIYRPSPIPGGAADRIALEDASFNGYGIQVNHSANTLLIERRTGGAATALSTVSIDPPEDQWYRVALTRTAASFSVTLFDSVGTVLASTTATDSTHGGADRVVVHGGYTYYVDDITVTSATTAGTTVAIDSRGNLNGTYFAAPGLGQPSLIEGETDTSTSFNGTSAVTLGDNALLNTSTRSQRSAELWFRADTVTGRQVLYEEGGSTNGMVIYLEGAGLRARAWSDSTGWTNELDTVASVTAGTTYHVVVTLDTDSNPNQVLYLNGSQVDTASKPDTQLWNAHTDDGAIAVQNGSTRYHDGTFGATGTNYFQGTVDDVSIYNTVLSPSRVQARWIAGGP
jgi:signal peptidase I